MLLYLTQNYNQRAAQALTASYDLIGHSVMIEAKPKQLIDKVMVRLEVLCNCRVIRLLHTLWIQRAHVSQASILKLFRTETPPVMIHLVVVLATHVITLGYPRDYTWLRTWLRLATHVTTLGYTRDFTGLAFLSHISSGYLWRVQEWRMKEHVELRHSGTRYRLAANDHFGVTARKVWTMQPWKYTRLRLKPKGKALKRRLPSYSVKMPIHRRLFPGILSGYPNNVPVPI